MNEKIIYALGFFDGVHIGHRALLRACRELAQQENAPVGAVTFTAHPDTLVLGKTPPLINTAADRKMLLRRYGADRIVELPFDTAMMTMPWQDFLAMLVRDWAAAGLVCGRDFRFGCAGRGDSEALRAYCKQSGLSCTVVPEQTVDGTVVSSTGIRTLLEQGQLEQAGRFLGHPHIFSGTVVSGRQLGRTMGIPTANLSLPPEVLRMPRGVYACKALAQGTEYLAVTNLGCRPTVGGRELRAESWLLDFSGDLYGQPLTLEFHRHLRPELKFESLEALQAEIHRNAAQTKAYFAVERL